MVLHLACVSTEGPMLSHNWWSEAGGQNFRRLLGEGRGIPSKVSRTLQNIPVSTGAGEVAWWLHSVT